ncbi:predicted protein [Postia placenta Mad-698-R]|nr:predicted protein [Postia placenta Mad-698-R]
MQGPFKKPFWEGLIAVRSCAVRDSDRIQHREPSLPAETWLQVFDELAQGGDYEAIATCADVCNVFREWSKRYITGSWSRCFILKNEADVQHAKEDVVTKGLLAWPRVSLASVVGEESTRAIPHIASFASTFAAGKWVRIEELAIQNASWPSSLRAADAAVFRDFSCFTSITCLFLSDVTFPSIVTFGALVSALPGLEKLYLCDVKFARSSFLFDPRTLSDFRFLPQPKGLERLYLGIVPGRVDSEPWLEQFTPTAWQWYTELLDFISSVSSPCGGHFWAYPWDSVRHLTLHESVWWRFSSSSIARLLHALPSLWYLIFGNKETNVPDLEITGVHAHRRLTPINIGVDCLAQPQHVDHIIRCLIEMDYPLRITQIYASIYPFLYAIISIYLRTQTSNHSKYMLDWNTVSAIDLDPGTFDWSSRDRLNRDLLRLDAVLSLPIFDNLVHIPIRMLPDQSVGGASEEEMKEQSRWTGDCGVCTVSLIALLSIAIFRIIDLFSHSIEAGDSHRGPIIKLGLIWDDNIEEWQRYTSEADERGNVAIVKTPAFKGDAPSEAMAAYTAWYHNDTALPRRKRSWCHGVCMERELEDIYHVLQQGDDSMHSGSMILGRSGKGCRLGGFADYPGWHSSILCEVQIPGDYTLMHIEITGGKHGRIHSEYHSVRFYQDRFEPVQMSPHTCPVAHRTTSRLIITTAHPTYSMQISHKPSLPEELWMQILDDILSEWDYDAIARCARVCRFFQYICRPHLQLQLTFRSKGDAERLKTDIAAKELGGWRGPKYVIIEGESDSNAISHVPTLASKFAGKWTRVEKLTIENASWPSSLRAANDAVFQNLSRFASITDLSLFNVTFPSIVTFGALVSALPRLNKLFLRDVKLTRPSFPLDPRTLADFRLLPQLRCLQEIDLAIDRHKPFTPTAWPCYTELLDFITAVSNPCGKFPRVYPWGSVRRLQLNESVWWRFSSSSITRLLRALPSLEFFAFISARGIFGELNIIGVPAYPGLNPIHILVECGIPSSQHELDIVRSLIKMNYPLRITDIHTQIFPGSQETDTVSNAIKDLVTHAGPSLEHLYFDFIDWGADVSKHYPEVRTSADQYIWVLFDNELHRHHEKELKEWAYLMKSSFASFDKRGVLGIEMRGQSWW